VVSLLIRSGIIPRPSREETMAKSAVKKAAAAKKAAQPAKASS
jgi:hypothetical protein